MPPPLPRWVEDAAALPLRFAQVREDPLLDLDVVAALPPGVRAFAIASGGCTAALLATSPRVARLVLADPNPAQVALARLKVRLVAVATPEERLHLLGHAPMEPEHRTRSLAAHLGALDLATAALGPPDVVARDGPDHAGRYERVFAALRGGLGDARAAVEAAFDAGDAAAASRLAPGTPAGDAFDRAFDDALALPVLVRLFGEEATRNPVRPFARHFAERTRAALAAPGAARNPWLAQVILGRWLPGAEAPWIRATSPAGAAPATAEFREAFADAALDGARGEFDLVHLSNVLDWLSPEAAAATLDRARRALRAGGRVIVRQLNSSLDIPSLGPGFRWLREEAAALHARDRSYFYAAVHVGEAR